MPCVALRSPKSPIEAEGRPGKWPVHQVPEPASLAPEAATSAFAEASPTFSFLNLVPSPGISFDNAQSYRRSDFHHLSSGLNDESKIQFDPAPSTLRSPTLVGYCLGALAASLTAVLSVRGFSPRHAGEF